MSDEEWRNSVRCGDPWMTQQPTGAPVAPIADEVMGKPAEEASEGMATGSGGVSNDATGEPSMARPRLIPWPDSQLPPDSAVAATVAFGRNCAPSQAPASDLADYDQLS